MIENYEKYLHIIQKKLDNFFEKQKDYIFCKEGCTKCCKNAQFPFSEIEYKYLIEQFKTLPDTAKNQIKANVKKILYQKQNFTGEIENFTYTCPFLINDSCSCYTNRGLICRIFGLLSKSADDKIPQLPFCIKEGLNYSNVYNNKTNKFAPEKYKKHKFTTPPLIFDIDYKTLIHPAFAKGFNFKFGNVYSLIEHIEKSPLP